MIQFDVANWRGIKDASIKLDELTIVCGKNGAGKTSLLEGVAAATEGDPLGIYKGFTKRKMKEVIFKGATQSMVTVDLGEGSKCRTQLPEATHFSEGQEKFVSRYALGLDDVMELDSKKRMRFLTEFLNSKPSKEDLLKEIKDAEFSEEFIKRIWETVESLGWNAAYEQAKEKGAALKGAWEHITGDNYGTIKGANWLPASWTPDLLNAEKDVLDSEAETARKAHFAGQGVTLTDRVRISLEAKAEEEPKIEKQMLKIITKKKKIQEDITNIQFKINEVLNVPDVMNCPGCDVTLYVQDKKLVLKKDIMSKEDRNNLLNFVMDQKADLDNAFDEKDKELEELQALLSDINDAKLKLASQSSSLPEEEQEKNLKARQLAENRLLAYDQRKEASEKHSFITKSIVLVKALSESGVRLKKLVETVKGINDMFNGMIDDTGWEPIRIEDDLSLTYGSRPYVLLSQSEQLRVKIMFQLLIAYEDKSQFMLIDRADVLDKQGRVGLLALVKRHKVPALIAMTLNSLEEVPVFTDRFHGWRSYWIEGNVAKEVYVDDKGEKKLRK